MKQVHENRSSMIEKFKLFFGILNGKAAYADPFFTVAEIIHRCNLACPGCIFHSPEVGRMPEKDDRLKDMPLALFKKICKELAEMRTKEILITGEGEPFLHPDLIEMIRIAKKSNLHTTVLTNGVLLNTADIESLVNTKIDIIRVSLWATSKQSYRKSYPGSSEKNFNKILNGLKKITEFKKDNKLSYPLISLHHPITKINYPDIRSIVDLALKAGAGAVSFSPVRNWEGKLSSWALDPEDEKQLKILLNDVKIKSDRVGLKHNIGPTLLRYKIGEKVWENCPCYIGWYHTRIRIDGSVTPCGICELDFGNVNNSSIRTIWNNPRYQRFRNKLLRNQGIKEISGDCDCAFCCHLVSNYRIHRIMKWFPQFNRNPR